MCILCYVHLVLDPETHTTRQATQHDCLARLQGDGGQKIVYGEEKNILLGQPEQPRQNIVHRHDKPNELTKKGPLVFVLFESPFTSVSTVSRGHLSLVSLAGTHRA